MILNGKAWLVTGAAGFIGSHVAERLLTLGCSVRGLDDFSTGKRSNIDAALAAAGARGSFELIEGDITDATVCARACEGVDRVVHLAALASVPLSIAEPRRALEVNEQGAANVIDAARRAGARIVFASSSAIYGNVEKLPIDENDAGLPLSPYALSKASNERTAELFYRIYGVKCVGLRFFNVYGPRQDPNGAYAAVVPRWIAAFKSGARPIVFGDGSATRDLCHVSDVAAAVIAAAETEDERAFGNAFNIACGRSTSLLELFALMRDAIGAPRDLTPDFQPKRDGDILHSSASISRARDVLRFEPRVTLEEGIASTIAKWQ